MSVCLQNWPFEDREQRPVCTALCQTTATMTPAQKRVVHMYNVLLWLTVFIVLQVPACLPAMPHAPSG